LLWSTIVCFILAFTTLPRQGLAISPSLLKTFPEGSDVPVMYMMPVLQLSIQVD
jgi:hypothetical protein